MMNEEKIMPLLGVMWLIAMWQGALLDRSDGSAGNMTSMQWDTKVCEARRKMESIRVLSPSMSVVSPGVVMAEGMQVSMVLL